MKSVWLDIELSDYEKHMALPDVAQSQYLSEYFAEVLELYHPNTVGLIGCSGGNGIEKLDKQSIEKVVCVDINPNFIEEAKNRYKTKIKDIEFVCEDITSKDFKISNVDLIFIGLVLEYVEVENAINNLVKSLNPNGILVVVLQQPNKNIAEVTPSIYKSLEKLSQIFRFVSAKKLIEHCNSNDLKLIKQISTQLKSSKTFTELIFQKPY